MNYRLFTKMEWIVDEFQNQLTIFDRGVLSCVRGITKDKQNNEVVIPSEYLYKIGEFTEFFEDEYKNSKYNTPYNRYTSLGEFAEKCEEIGLADSVKNLRSILMGFVMETKTINKEKFSGNQFETFKEIYTRVIGKDHSILDEILLKKCESQVNDSGFDLKYEIFNEESFAKATIEEQTLSILALSAYNSYVTNEEMLSKHEYTFIRALKVFCENKESDLDVLSYISLSHIYDIIQLNKNIDKSLSSKQKQLYKLIKEVTTTDLSEIFKENDDLYKEEVFVCNYYVKLDKLLDISYRATIYKSTEIMALNSLTLTQKCKKIGQSFNYALTKGDLHTSKIEEMRTLYRNQHKDFKFRYLFDYINLEIIDDVNLYCELFQYLNDIFPYSAYFEMCNTSSFEKNCLKIMEKIFDLYDNGNLSEIKSLCLKYKLFEVTLTKESMMDLKALKVLYLSEKTIENDHFTLSDDQINLLVKNNRIDRDLNITIDDVYLEFKDSYIEGITICAWYNNMKKFAIELTRKYQLALEAMINEFGLGLHEPTGYDSTEACINETLEVVKEADYFDIVFNFIYELLIKSRRVDELEKFIKSNFEEVIRIYKYTGKDKELLIRKLIQDNVDVVNKRMIPDDFLISTIGIDNAFRILGLNNSEALDIKINYINRTLSRTSLTPAENNYIQEIKNSLSQDDLEYIAINVHKMKIDDMLYNDHSVISVIKYFEEHQEVVFKHCLDELKSYIAFAMNSEHITTLSLLYVYLNEKNIKELDDILDKMHDRIQEVWD